MDTKGAKLSLNPFCELALEEALRLKERGVAGEASGCVCAPVFDCVLHACLAHALTRGACLQVHAVSIGHASAADSLRTALALGADRVTHVVLQEGAPELQPLGVAKVLAALVRRESVAGKPPELVLLGKQAIDGDAGQTGQMLAALLDWPQAVAAAKLECDTAAGTADVTREGDAGLSTVRLTLPAVVTSDLRLNEPRFATLAATLRAKKAPIARIDVADLAADTAPRLTVLRVDEPPKRPPGVRVANVDELLARLRERGAL